MSRSWTFELQKREEWRPQHELSRHAQRHTLVIIIGRPPSIGGPINTASACVFSYANGFFLVTANHVFSTFEALVAEDASIRWQVSFRAGSERHLVFDPRERVSLRNADEDIAAIQLSAAEVEYVGVTVCSMPLGWPPPPLAPGDFLVMAGYPAMYREKQGPQVSFPALSAVFEVTSSGRFHPVWQWDRDRMVNTTGGDVPQPGPNLGGMSGGPVFLLQDLVYPLVGVATGFNQSWELLRMAQLGALGNLGESA